MLRLCLLDLAPLNSALVIGTAFDCVSSMGLHVGRDVWWLATLRGWQRFVGGNASYRQPYSVSCFSLGV